MKNMALSTTKFIGKNTVFKIYLLYPINRDDEGNFYLALKKYSNIGTEIESYLIDWEKMSGLPKSYLYVPADHEVFIFPAYTGGFLTKEEIISINCKIIGECDLLILFGSVNSNTATELQFVKQEEIPIYTMPDLSPMAIQALKLAIKLIIRVEE